MNAVAPYPGPRAVGDLPTPQFRPDTLESAKSNLVKDIRIVKRARFNASKRFETKNDFSLGASSIFSFYLIFVAVYMPLYEDAITKDKMRLLNLISIASSVFILMVSLIQAM